MRQRQLLRILPIRMKARDFYDFSKNPQSNAENAWNIEGFITGLYNGPAGGGVLAEYLYDIEPDEKYRAFSEKAAADIIAGAKKTEKGMYWTDVSDLMSDGGLVLYLLFMYKRTENAAYLEAAKSAGDFILSNAIDAGEGKCFELLKLNELGFSKGKYFPNFSHGTAGVGYLFASLYELSGESRYLDIARENARYIESLAVGDDNGILIPYVDPPEEELFYLGVCHGPIGTSKLFRKLYQATGEEHYKNVVIRLAGGLIRAHAPQVHSKGYWNNECFCCGSPGMLEFFVEMYEFTNDRQYLRLADESADIIIGNSYEKEGKRRWYSAWARSAPNKVESYTGLYVGSSGCAASLLRLYGCKHGVETIPYPEDLI